MILKEKSKISALNQNRLNYISMLLKEMRISEGLNQDGFVDFGLSRRQIQSAEYGKNITVKKLLLILDCYGYSLKDLEIEE